MDGIDISNLSIGWAFVGAVLCINVLAGLGKTLAKQLNASEPVRWLVAHVLPVALSLVIAFIPEMRVEGIDGLASRIVFFIGVGGTAAWWYRLVKAGVNFVLRKLGAETLPTTDAPPPRK